MGYSLIKYRDPLTLDVACLEVSNDGDGKIITRIIALDRPAKVSWHEVDRYVHHWLGKPFA
jgi:hypothetical protein